MYTKPGVGEIIKWLNNNYHCYANDTQVYITLKPHNKWDDILSSIEACTEDIIIWVNCNKLKLKKDKTKFIIFSSKQLVKKTENLCIKVGSSYINSSMSVRNLGIIFDTTLGMEKQVNSICKFCYY